MEATIWVIQLMGFQSESLCEAPINPDADVYLPIVPARRSLSYLV